MQRVPKVQGNRLNVPADTPSLLQEINWHSFYSYLTVTVAERFLNNFQSFRLTDVDVITILNIIIYFW